MLSSLLCTKTFIFELNIPQSLLEYVRVSIIGDFIVNNTINQFRIIGEKFLLLETTKSSYSMSFKKIGENKYQGTVQFSMYVDIEENLPPINPINLTLLISYLNEQGHYELRKYKA